MNSANGLISPLRAALLAIALSACSPLVAKKIPAEPSAGIPACANSQAELAHITALSPGMEADDKEREKWNRVPDVIAALGVKEGSSVADVGAGPGFFTLRLACAVGPSGRVFAIDISKKALATLRKRLRKGGFKNVQVIHGKPDDPKLPPASLNAALFVMSYHEMKFHQAILEHARRALKPEGRIVLMEQRTYWESLPREEVPRDRLENRHELDPQMVNQDLQEAHFQVIDRQPAFLKRVSEFSLTAAQPAK